MSRLVSGIVLLSLAGVAVGCSSRVAGGSTTETTNSVVASARYPDGIAAAGALVRLRPDGYLAVGDGSAYGQEGTVKDAIADGNGKVILDGLAPGAYSLEITDRNNSAVLARFEIPENGKRAEIGKLVLSRFATLTGKVDPDHAGGITQIGIYGLERNAAVDPSTGVFTFSDLPSASLKVHVAPDSMDYAAVDQVVTDLAPSKTTTLDSIRLVGFASEDYLQWSHAKSLRLNTTASGADVDEEVHGFPILVRLDSGNFPFDQAQPDGHDLRFSKFDGTKLRYQIESWDPVARRACIWVLMDTVFAGNDTQGLRMHWGKAGVADFSRGASVFPASSGFTGVWHLDPSVRDATPGRNSAIIGKPNAPEGIIGRGKGFFTINDSLRIPDRPDINFGTGDYCASIWVNQVRQGSVSQIFSKRVQDKGHFEMQIQADGAVRFHFRLLDSSSFLASKTRISTDRWYHLCALRTGGMAILYVDGREEARMKNPDDVGSASDMLLGRDTQDSEPLVGVLDEFRLNRVARSSGWIRLEYENQKQGGSFISFD